MAQKKYRQEDWLRERYVNDGLSTRKVAELADTTHSTIRRWLSKNDIETRSDSEAAKNAFGTIHPNIYLGGNDRPYWVVQSANPDSRVPDSFLLHRLTGVAWFGWDAVIGNDIHHKNTHTLDNRESNLEPIGHAEHTTKHHKNGDIHS